MALNTLEDALLEELRDMLSAEKQLVRALPKMAKKASADDLREAFEEHLGETETQVQRLEKVFEALDRKPRTKKCEAMAGLILEGEEVMKEEAEPAVRDALLIAAAQKVEHYEIASYGTLCTWAKTLRLSEALELLKENMSEETAADKKLSKLAAKINPTSAS